MSEVAMEQTGTVSDGQMLAPAVAAEVERLSQESDGRLLEMYQTTMGEFAAAIVRAAAIVAIWETRGNDLTRLRGGLAYLMRKIAYGQLLPELLLWFNERRWILGRIARLPITDQERLVTDEPMEMVVIDDGQQTARLVTPSEMLPDEAVQLLDTDHIRTEAEQVRWLSAAETKDRRTRPRDAVEGVVTDIRHRQIIVTGTKVRIGEKQMLEYLRRFSERE